MDKIRQVIPVYLFAISAFLAIAAAAFYIWDHPDVVTDVVTIESEESESDDVITDTSVTEVSVVKGDGEDISFSEDVSDNQVSDNEPIAEPEPEIIKVENPYKEQFLENSDMIAWIKIPDTEVDFPVMWTPEDENYYLYRGFDKEYSRVGLPLMDTDSQMYPSSTNLIVHGHNIKNYMFWYILQYKSEDYYKEHPYIYLYGKDCEHIYEIMAVFRSKVYYTTDTCFKYYKFFNAETEEEFKDYYDNVMDMALYETGVTAEFGDKFLTLSTCSSHTENGRFVVVAKEIEPGDIYYDLDEEDNP